MSRIGRFLGSVGGFGRASGTGGGLVGGAVGAAGSVVRGGFGGVGQAAAHLTSMSRTGLGLAHAGAFRPPLHLGNTFSGMMSSAISTMGSVPGTLANPPGSTIPRT
jgi:hypothetical protein